MAITGLLVHPLLPDGVDRICFQLVACGVLLLIDGFPGIHGFDLPIAGMRLRWGRPVVMLSGLTMYFFMFQHVIAVDFIRSSVNIATSGFSSFNYWGLAALALAATFFVSLLASGIESKLRFILGKTN